MKALKVTLLEIASVEPVRALSRGLGRFIFAASLLIIFFAGTFPFDFTFTSANLTPFDFRLNQYDPGFQDRFQNILFFVPFGFGYASIIRTQLRRMELRLITSPLASFLLSLLVEWLQRYVSFRDPSVMDLWANTLGGSIGAGVYILYGDRMLAAAARGLLQLKRFATPQLAGGVLAVYAAFHLGVPLLLRDPGDLSVWDPDLPLVVGNELTGDRPWTGTISEVTLADRAATETQVARLARGESPQEVLRSSLLAHYRPAGDGPYRDLSNQLPPLEWTAHPTTIPSSDLPPVLDAKHWLKTSGPVTPAIQKIMASSEFTFSAVVSTPDLGQRGPARLASISGSTATRNVQLGQEFADLVVRVRNAMRSAPELHVQDVFTLNTPRRVLITSRAAETIVYIDGKEVGRMHITPEAKIIWRLYPRPFRLRIEEYGFRAYAATYRAIIFIPFAALLGATLLLLKWPIKAKAALAITSIITMAALIEVVLSRLGGTFEPINAVISLIVGFGTLATLILWRRVRDTAD